MSAPSGGPRDFFVSFNSADRAWAEWIASELEAAGYTTYFQHWDFRPGSNFVLEMDKAAANTRRTIAVLSPDYLNARFTQPEWAAALGHDPNGAKRGLIPVRVRPCQIEGLLQTIVYADLVGLDETEARRRLLDAVKDERPKPAHVPFPKSSSKPFPGSTRQPASPPPPPQDPPPDPPRPPSGEPDPALKYAIISAIWLAIGIGLFILMLSKAELLATLGLTGRAYYVVLIPIALSSAAFLFNVLRSVAVYRGERFGGTLMLGGPIIAAALVVWGAYQLPPPELGTFSITVFPHGPGGPLDRILRGKGQIVMDLHGNRRPELVDDKGAAHFVGIPAEFRAQPVAISLEAEGFEQVDSTPRKLAGESIYLPVRRRPVHLAGYVFKEGGDPLPGATVRVGELTASSNHVGWFSITLPPDDTSNSQAVDFSAPGYVPQNHSVTPGANEMRVSLERRK